jgi:hypothetical protein
MKGCAKANTRKVIKAIRAKSISMCFSRRKELVVVSTFLRNATLVKYTFLVRLKLNKCIAMGILIAAKPNKKEGYKKFMKPEINDE